MWTPSAKIYDFEISTKYYWRVYGWNEAGPGPWSEVWNFTTSSNVSVNDPGESYFKSSVYPNPFNGLAILQITLPEASHVVVKLYNTMGEDVKLIMNKTLDAGQHNIPVNAADLSSGLYFYSIQADGKNEINRLIISK